MIRSSLIKTAWCSDIGLGCCWCSRVLLLVSFMHSAFLWAFVAFWGGGGGGGGGGVGVGGGGWGGSSFSFLSYAFVSHDELVV